MTANFTTGQDILINLDPRRAPRPGTYVAPADRDGFATVSYHNAKTGEQVEKDVNLDKIAPVEVDTDGIDAPAVDEVPEVQVDAEDEPQGPHTHDECDDLDNCTADHLPATVTTPTRKVKVTKKAELPEGYVTPVGLAKEINARGLYSGNGARGFTSQMLYSLTAKDDTFPGEVVNDRNAVNLEAGLEWWNARTERVAQRRSATPKTAVRIDGELRERVEARATEVGKSVAELVEYALNQYLG